MAKLVDKFFRFAKNINKLLNASGSLVTSKDLEEVFLYGYGTESDSGIIVNRQSAIRHATVSACVRVLTSTIAQIPFYPYEIKDGDNRILKASTYYRLMTRNVSNIHTSFEWKEMMMRDLLFDGNSYSYKVKGIGDRVQALLRIHPKRICPKEKQSSWGEIIYELTKMDGKKDTLNQDEILHIRGPSDDGIKGLDPMTIYRESIGDAIALVRHGSKFFSNGAKPLGLLKQEMGTQMERKDRMALIQDFNEMHAGTSNVHRVGFLPAGIDYKPVTISMEDAQYIESRKFSRQEIASIYGVPLHKIGDLEKATFNNVEHNSIDYVQDTVKPICIRIENCLDFSLFGSDMGRFFKADMSTLLQGDFKTRQEGYAIQKRNGVISANEWRAKENMNKRADDGGDRYTIEKNMGTDDPNIDFGNVPNPDIKVV